MSLKDLIKEKLEEYFLWRRRLAQLDWSSLPDEPTVAEANRFLWTLQDRYTWLQWIRTDSEGPIKYFGLGALLWPRFSTRKAPTVRADCLPVTNADGYPLLRWIFPSSPASDAGLHIGDALLSVDRQDVINVPIARLARSVLGNQDSAPVYLDILPADGGKVRSVSLIRRVIEPPLVFTQQEAGIDYLHLPRLNLKRAASDFQRILSKLTGWGLIMDLRGFRGCDLPIFRQLAAPLLKANQIIGRREEYVQGHLTSSEVLCPTCDQGIGSKPIAGLIDHSTLSGGEGLVGALQYYKRATIIGENTGGKGVSQFHLELSECDKIIMADTTPVVVSYCHETSGRNQTTL